jgi:hypothetical protein
VSPATTPTTALPASATTGSAPTTAAAPLVACPSGAVRASFDIQPPTGPQPVDRVRALVVLTDASAQACRVDGWAGVGAVVGGVAVSVPVVRVDQPGDPAGVDLEPGASAFAGVEWTSESSCPAVSSWVVTPPDQDATVPVEVDAPGGSGVPLYLCAGNFDEGPLEATTEGTVAFPDSVGNGLPECSPAVLRATLATVAGTGGSGVTAARLVLTNAGSGSCLTGGYVGLQLISAAGGRLPTKVVRAPAPDPEPLTIGPGQSVYATVTFAGGAGHGAELGGSCEPPPVSAYVVPPDQKSQLEVTGPGAGVCDRGSVVVTALEAGTGG